MSNVKVVVQYWGEKDPRQTDVNYSHLEKYGLRKHAMKRVIADMIVDDIIDIENARTIELFYDFTEDEES
jgi:hypothetical protein